MTKGRGAPGNSVSAVIKSFIEIGVGLRSALSKMRLPGPLGLITFYDAGKRKQL